MTESISGGHADGAGTVLMGDAVPADKFEARFWRAISDEIAEVVAHGGRGTLSGLLAHLNARFGHVSERDLAGGLALAGAHVREVFHDDR